MKNRSIILYSALNRPNLWYKPLRPWFNAESFQQRLDAQVGTNKDGKSIIRLGWAQEITTRAYGEEIPRYWVKRQKIAGGFQYYTVPRWVLEKRLEPEQFVPAWEASRYSMVDPLTGATVDKGDPPTEWYTFAYLCAEHEAVDPSSGWAGCCARAYYTDRSRCWGRYRPPSEDDLMLVRQAVRQMEAEKWVDPYAPLTQQQLDEAEYNANMQVAEADAQLAEMQAEMSRDFYRLHGHRIFEGPDTFHDMSVRTPGGLVVPD